MSEIFGGVMVMTRLPLLFALALLTSCAWGGHAEWSVNPTINVSVNACPIEEPEE